VRRKERKFKKAQKGGETRAEVPATLVEEVTNTFNFTEEGFWGLDFESLCRNMRITQRR